MVLRGDSRPKRIVGAASPVYIVGASLGSEDELSKQFMVLGFIHHEVHEGDTFQASEVTEEGNDIADNTSYEMLLVTGDVAEAHIVYVGGVPGTSELLVFEDTIVSNNGRLLDTQNMMRRFHGEKLNTTLAYITPTVTNDGLRIQRMLLPGGMGPGQSTSGGTVRQDSEWVWKVNTNYLIRLTNRSGSAQKMGIVAQWYEEVPQD